MSRENFTHKATLGDRIRRLREAKGLSQSAFAEKLEISGNYKTRAVVVSRWERGERKPNSIYLTRMAIIFKAGINWLLTGEGEMFMNSGGAGVVAEASAPYGLTDEERQIFELLRANPKVTGPLLKILLSGRGLKEGLDELKKIIDPLPETTKP